MNAETPGCGDLELSELTAPGPAGIAVWSLRGSGAREVIERLFRPASEKGGAGRSLLFGRLLDGSETLDEVLLRRLPDGFELMVHGGAASGLRVREVFLREGARIVADAAPSPTRRRGVGPAVEAEAREGLATARTEEGVLFFAEVLEGRLAGEILAIRTALAAGAESPARAAVLQRLEGLLRRTELGLAFADPPRIVIAGPQNAGKSTLWNALLGGGRAIVSGLPGTTRDVLTAPLDIGGCPFVLSDTAGTGSPRDALDRAAMDMAARALRDADIVLEVVDGAGPPEADSLRAPAAGGARRHVTVLSKMDRPDARGPGDVERALGRPVLGVSAASGEGLQDLRTRLFAVSPFGGPATRHQAAPFTRRQVKALEVARRLAIGDPAGACRALDELLEGSPGPAPLAEPGCGE